ncbi:MAG: helix-turn-helix domain-containing protein, partial [Actinobacteria bacterium]|nr:helix-turn-helix domain-containing protein [Actinomycetota bacterium]
MVASSDDELLTVDEAVERLGVSAATIRRRCAAGQIPARKIGKSWLIEGSDLPAAQVRTARRRPRAASGQVDLTLALSHLRSHDLKQDIWVPDILRHEDDLQRPEALIAAAAGRLDLEEPFDPASFVPVPKSPVFPRNAVDLSLVDRLAYQAAVAACAPLIWRQASKSAYSARPSGRKSYFLGNGRDAWLQWKHDVVTAITTNGPWMAETDITAFFDFIKHELLLPEVQQLGVDHTIVSAMREMLRAWSTTPNTGLPQGPNASRLLANFYMAPIDLVMESFPKVCYFRFMDDIRLVGESRASVISALQLLDAECRRRGLALSSKKTELHRGSAAADSMEDAELDALQYAFNAGSEVEAVLRKQLRKVFKASMMRDGGVDSRRARFSLSRLFRLRDRSVLGKVLERLEVLAPLRELAPKYLHPWMRQASVQRRLTTFLHDTERNTSVFLSSWLIAVMVDLEPPLPEEWIDYARAIACD